MEETYNGSVAKGITEITAAAEAEEKDNVYDLFNQGMSNMEVVQATGVAHTKVVMLRISYEKAHLSGN